MTVEGFEFVVPLKELDFDLQSQHTYTLVQESSVKYRILVSKLHL